ncbi:MAG: tetratricopeptide repeat protein [Deltaproteobacteria bacterium]|nr:tetratricopeptide repeat protein [Deltaproteobacteria bacterium]
MSPDGGTTWRETISRLRAGAVWFELPGEGRFDCYLVIENESGASNPPPSAGSAPHGTLVVDATAPVLQIQRARIIGEDERILRISVTLIEENLGDAGLRLFYRGGKTEAWKDAGTVRVVARMVDWPLPLDLPPVFDIRLIATDLAGNRCSDEWQQIRLPERRSAAEAPDQDPARLAADEVRAVSQPGSASSGAAVAEESIGTLHSAQHLQKQAREFRTTGRLPLALARLREARAIRPDDRELANEYAETLLESGDATQAGTVFEEVARLDPNDARAAHGLAAVAFQNGKFEAARIQVRKALDLDPKSVPGWMLLGDIEIRLGRRAEAREIWKNALQIENTEKSLKDRIQHRLDAFP